MSKLSPRPDYNGPLYSWDKLNNMLQISFNAPGKRSAVIDLRQFSIPEEEIIVEAEKQGYKVHKENEYFLRFE